MPAKQTFGGQGLLTAGRGVEHHVHHAFHVLVHRSHGTNVHTETPGDGGPHGFHIQDVTFYLAGLDYVFSQGSKARLVPQRQTHISQTAE